MNAFDLYSRLSRPTLSWIGVIGAAYGMIIGPWIGRPLDAVTLGIVLGFNATIFGLRGIERIKGLV